MLADHYQNQALSTAIYPNIGHNFLYPTLGLVGEAGEVAEKVKKIIRDQQFPHQPFMGDASMLPEETRLELAKELSDVCWYAAVLSKELGFSLSEIMAMNIEKLQSRQQRGVLGGSGDNR